MTTDPRVGWRHRRVWHAIGATLVAAVVVLSLLPPAEMPGPVLPHDKLGHVAAYCSLMGWYVQLVAVRRWRLALWLVLLGVLLEGVQALTGYRTFELADILADCAGVGLGWHVSAVWFPGVLHRIDRALSPPDGAKSGLPARLRPRPCPRSRDR